MNAKILKQVAALAKLDVPEEKIDELAEEFSQIVAYVEQMNAGVAIATENARQTAPVQQRNDEGLPGLSHAQALANAPEHDETTFIVPLVLE